MSNLYNLEVVNKTFGDLDVELRPTNPKANIKFVGKPLRVIKHEGVSKTAFFLELPQSSIQENKTPIEIAILSKGKVIDRIKTTFMAPVY